MNLATVLANIDSSSIVSILNTALLAVFILIIVSLIFAFLRGLFRGWRYGTYRLGYFLLHIIIGLALLEVIANTIGQIDIASIMGQNSMSVSLGGAEITFTVSTLEGTINDFCKQAMQSYSPSTDPASVSNIAYSFTKSILKWLTVFIEGILLITIVNFFCWLLWHIAFKRIIPSGIRKRTYKKGKLVSAFEEFFVSALCLCMVIAPLSSVVNSAIHGFENASSSVEDKEKLKANNETYKLISDVADAYNDSVFAKVFFAARDENNYSFDQGLMNWLTTSSSGDNGLEVSFIKELQYVAGLGTLVVESGLLSENATTNYKVYLFITSKYPSLLISSLAKSDIVTGLLPFAFSILTNMDALEQYIGNKWNIDYSSNNWSNSIDNIAGLFDDIQHSGVIDLLTYDETEDKIVFAASNASNLFTEESKAKFESAFARISNDNDEWKVFNNLLISFLVNTVINSSSSEEASSSLSLCDFLPAVSDEYYEYDEAKGRNVPTNEIPPDYASLNIADEIGYIYRSLARVNDISGDFVGNVIEGVLNNSLDTSSLLATMVDSIDEVVSIFTGEDEDGVIQADEKTGRSENGDCLLDSSLICNAMPKVFKILGQTLGSSMSVEVDVDAVNNELFYDEEGELLPLNERLINEKTEVSHLLGVASSFAKTDVGKNLLKNLDTMPGFTYNPDESKSLAYIDPDILDALASSLGKIDDSIFLSKAIPNLFAGLLTNAGGALSSFGITSDDFNFSPVDENGDSVLGKELGKMLTMYRDCQDLFNYIKDNSDSLSSGGDTSAFLKGLAPFCNDGEEGAKGSSLYSLLNGFSSSKILNDNPNHEEENYNYRLLMNKVLTTALGEGYEYNGSISDVSEENVAICKILSCMVESDLLDMLNGSSISLSSFLDFDFEALLSPLQETTMLRSVFTTFLDKTICEGALSSSEDAMKGVSFENVVDWSKEGKTLNLLISFADRIGDFSNLDLFNSDPDAVTGILSCLSSSQLFLESDGTYHFGQFLYYTLTDSMESDALSFFSDRDGTGSTQLLIDMESLSQTDWSDEASVFGDIVAALKSLGGMDQFSSGSIDFGSINLNAIGSMLDSLSKSKSVGRVLSYHFYEKIGEELKNSSFELGGGHGDDALSEKVGNLNIDEVWESYDDGYQGLLTDRSEEYSLLTNILFAATSPKYGIIADDGSFGDGFSLSSTSGEFLVKPVLTYMSESIVFNTLNANAVNEAKEEGKTITYTAFECEMAQIVYDAGIYGKDEDGTNDAYNKIRDEYVKSIRPSVDYDASADSETDFAKFKESYKAEISSISSIIDGFKALDIDLANFSLTNFFSDSSGMLADAEIRKANLDSILYSINGSHLFYNLLPDKISEAFSGASISGMDTENANVEYLRAYDSDAAKGEISTITRILYYIEKTGLGNATASFSLDSIDPETTTDLLATMANSYVFNSLSESVTDENALTVFQSFLSQILGGDDSQLKDYYYLDDSPKDQANSGYYSNSKEKAEYIVKNTFKNLLAKDFTEEPVEILNGDSYSLKTFLALLNDGDNGLADALSGGDFTALDEDLFRDLLREINGNELFYDVVPNSLYKTINGDNLSIDGFKMSLANPFFVYNYDGEAYSETSDFERHYPDSEIVTLSSLIKRMSGLSSTLGNISEGGIDEDGIKNIKSLLLELYESKVFHKTGVNTDSSDYRAETSGVENLTVFEQTIYKLYSDSSLAKTAYSENYDGLYFSIWEQKLHDYVRFGTEADDSGENASGLIDFEGFSWNNEISYLTITDDADGGLLYTALSQGLLDTGVSLTEDNFSFYGEGTTSDDLKNIGKLSSALNELSIVRDVMPIQIEDLLSSLGFDAYGSLTKTFDFSSSPVSEYSFGFDSVYGYIISLEVTGSDVKYQYSFGSSYLGESDWIEEANWKEVRPLCVSIKGTDISKITVSFDTADYFLSKAQYAGEDGALNGLISFATGIMEANGGSYPKFDSGSNMIECLAKKGIIESALRYLDWDKGFYGLGYEIDDDSSIVANSENSLFYSRDITFTNMLSFSYSGNSIDLGKYMKRGDAYPYARINDVFVDNKSNADFYSNEDEFLRTNLAGMAANDFVIGNDTKTSATSISASSIDNFKNFGDIEMSYTISGIDKKVEFTIDKSVTKMLGLSGLASASETSFATLLSETISNRKGNQASAFGQYIVSGMLARLVKVQDEHAVSGSYLGSPIKDIANEADALGKATSTITPSGAILTTYNYSHSPISSSHQTSAQTLHASLLQNRSIYEYADTLLGEESTSSLFGDLLSIEGAIGAIKHFASTPSTEEKTTAQKSLISLDSYTGDLKLLVNIFYSGSMYDSLTWNTYFYEQWTVNRITTAGDSSESTITQKVKDFQSVDGNGYLAGVETPFSFTNVACCLA